MATRARRVLVASTTLALAALSPAHGGTGGDTMPWNGPIDKIVSNLTGPTAKAAAVLLFVIAGIVWGTSNHERGANRLFQALIAAALLLAAPTILDTLGIVGALL
jgi:type IV secretory pathway VirB2 component (pilin)